MTAAQLAVFLSYTSHTVIRDNSGTVWVKKWNIWQRPGSLGDYDSSAIVIPYEVLWPVNPAG